MFQRPQLARNLVRRLATTNSALQRATTQPQVATRWQSCLTTTQPQITTLTTNINKRNLSQAPSDDANERIKKLVSASPVVVFMKGNPDVPQCGFSKAVVQILRMHGVQFDAYNVLDDEGLRSGIKVFSDWPTIPQVYINSSFVGGCDIILQMHQNGDLVDELKTVGIRSALLDK